MAAGKPVLCANDGGVNDVLVDGVLESRLRQGITTEVLGEGARDVWPDVGGFFDRMEAHGVSLNVGVLVPQSVARRAGGADWVRMVLDEAALGVVADDGQPELWADDRVVVVPLHDAVSARATADAALAANMARMHAKIKGRTLVNFMRAALSRLNPYCSAKYEAAYNSSPHRRTCMGTLTLAQADKRPASSNSVGEKNLFNGGNLFLC